MHPDIASLVAWCDGEVRDRSQIEQHLSQCPRCRTCVDQIRSQKESLTSSVDSFPVEDGELARLMTAIAAWEGGRNIGAASQLRRRLREQIELFCGSATLEALDRPGIKAENLLGTSAEILEAFLGSDAAQAIQDDVLRELDWRLPQGELD
jgi:hypothetical protein